MSKNALAAATAKVDFRRCAVLGPERNSESMRIGIVRCAAVRIQLPHARTLISLFTSTQFINLFSLGAESTTPVERNEMQ